MKKHKQESMTLAEYLYELKPDMIKTGLRIFGRYPFTANIKNILFTYNIFWI